MVLGLLDQLLIFSQLYLIELLGLLTGLELLELWHLIYPRLLTGFGMLVFFTNLSLMEFQVRYLALFLLFLVIENSSGSGWKVFASISSKYGSPQGSIFAPTLFLLHINDLPDNVICDTAIYWWYYPLFYTTLYFSIFYSELESDLRDTVDWGKKWLVDFNAGKTQLVLVDRSNNNGLLF